MKRTKKMKLWYSTYISWSFNLNIIWFLNRSLYVIFLTLNLKRQILPSKPSLHVRIWSEKNPFLYFLDIELFSAIQWDQSLKGSNPLKNVQITFSFSSSLSPHYQKWNCAIVKKSKSPKYSMEEIGCRGYARVFQERLCISNWM